MGAEAAISTVVQLLGDLLTHKVKFLRGVEDQVQILIDEMNTMQSFLRDANKKQGQDERVRNWILEIREVALEAEDTIEMFILNLEDARTSRGFLKHCIRFPNHVRHIHRIGKDIESIRARLDAIDKKRTRYGIKDLGESGEPLGRSEVEAKRRLAPWHKNEHLVGMEDDVTKLLELTTDEENKGLVVVAVVGMGGIGKSTLAREVYNHPNVVSGRFDCRGWVVVSSEFTPQETIKQLILETTSSEQQKQPLREEIKKLEESTRDKFYLQRKLEEMLHKQLEGKTYFIVVDDVWEKEHWDSLITAFPKEQDKTSRLLLTTRNKVIANQCQSLHEMRFLDSEESWELFLKRGLGNSNEEFPKDLEQIGRGIVEKCEGLPLVITVMGGLLAETRSNRLWEEALDQLNYHLGRAESSVSAILELSYQNLSPQLKSCFLCLAFFKEDATISVKRVLNLMVGQGLIQQIGRKPVNEIARGYLDELINKNLVQIKDLMLDNRVKSCHLHDSLRNLCLQKAQEEIGLVILKGDRGISLHKPCHCIVQCDHFGSLSMNQKKHMRSLILLNVEKGFKAINWKSFQRVKILYLDGNCLLKRFPHSFRLLRGLKQLTICSLRRIQLPNWLNTLKKLELLNMGNTDVKFPNVALEMDSLRDFHAYNTRGLLITDSCKNIETLKCISYKDWLRSSLRMKEVVSHIRELGIHLRDVGSLIENDESSRMRASLEKLENLVKLYLRWGPNDLPIDVTIIIPHLRNLTKLKLGGWMRKCPSASMLPPNLLHLTLQWSILHEDPMPELSKLTKLLYLKLKIDSYWGERMQVLHDGFPSLRGLSLQRLALLTSFDIEEGGMPQLKKLQVDDCPYLDTKNHSNKSYQLQIL